MGCLKKSSKAARKKAILDAVYDADDSLSHFSEVLEPSLDVWNKLLNMHLPQPQDEREVTSASVQSNFFTLKELVQEKTEAFGKVRKLLPDIVHFLTKGGRMKYQQRQLHFHETCSRGYSGHFKGHSEFGRLLSYFKKLKEENKSLHVQNKKLRDEKRGNKRSVQEGEFSTGPMKDMGNIEGSAAEGCNPMAVIEVPTDVFKGKGNVQTSDKKKDFHEQSIVIETLPLTQSSNRHSLGLGLTTLKTQDMFVDTGIQTEKLPEETSNQNSMNGENGRSAKVKEDKSLHVYENNASCHTGNKDNETCDEKEKSDQVLGHVENRERLEKLIERLRECNEENMERLERENASLLKDHEQKQQELDSENDELRKAHDSLKIRLERYRNEIKDILESITEIEIEPSLKQWTGDIENLIINLGYSVNKMRDENIFLKRQAFRDTEKLTIEEKNVDKQQAYIKEENKTLGMKMESIQEKKQKLTTELQTQKEAMVALQRKFDKQGENRTVQEQRTNKLQTQLQEARERISSLSTKINTISEENVSLKSTNGTQEEKYTTVLNTLEKQHFETSKLESINKTITEEIVTLKSVLQTQREKSDVVQNELEKEREQNSSLNASVKVLSKENKFLNDTKKKHDEYAIVMLYENEKQSNRLATLDSKVEALLGENVSLQSALKLQNERKDAIQSELDKSHERNSALDTNIQELSEKYSSLICELNTQERKVIALQNELDKQLQINSSLEVDIKGVSDKNIALQSELEASQERVREMQSDLEKERVIIAELMGELSAEKEKTQKLQNDFVTMKDELEKLKSAKVMHVQLYHHGRTGLIAEVQNELTALLKSEMEDAKTELNFIECCETSDIDLNTPLLIACINVSRLGTDAAKAIKSLKLTPKMALVVIHHKQEHALPQQTSDRILTGQAFSSVGGIYDLAFLSNKGVYTCEMNRQSVKKLVYFLQKEGVRSIKDI